MGVFDLEKAAKVLGSSSDPSLLDAIGMGFGAPQCILNMTEDLLSLLPSEMLGQMGGTLKDARDAANNATALITKKLFLDSGIIEFDTETGRWKFVGDSSKWGSDGGEGDALAALGGFLGALGYAATYGATLYNNIITLDGQIQNLQACLDKFGKILAANKGSGALASNFGLGLPGVCDGGTGSTALECQANGGTWIPDAPPGTCYGAEGSDEETCLDNGGTWSPGGIVEPPGGIGSFGPQGPDPDTQFAIIKGEMQESMNFAAKCDAQLKVIGDIFKSRVNNPVAEPVLRIEPLGGGDGIPEAILAGTNIRRTTQGDWARLLAGEVQVDMDGELVDQGVKIFRLEYGPPRAKQGQFLLTIDGLYYDSQSGGVPSVPTISLPPAGEQYLNKYAPNLGGKGTPIGIDELDIFMNTLFDPNLISDDPLLNKYYDGDHLLQQLQGERSKHLNDLTTEINKAIDAGSGTSVVYNMRQALMSNTAKHDSRVDKRKKQIELAVVTPGTFGSDASVPFVGHIPINDFTYLKDYNVRVSLEMQKNLIFRQAEVSGVVLPLHPLFVAASGSEAGFGSDHLMVPTIGKAGIIFDSSTTGDREVALLNLTDEITVDKLFSVYNFLEATTETPTVSPYDDVSKWGVLNCVASGIQQTLDPLNPIIYNNAKFLSKSTADAYVSGLSMPKLTGLVQYNTAGDTPELGNAVRLPESYEFNNLFYNSNGATIESWVYVPGIETSSLDHDNPNGAWGPYSYNRLIVGCENNGGVSEEITTDEPPNTFGSEHVKGFVMGFSRDRQVVSDLTPNDTPNDNPTEKMCFFAAPTISYNTSGIGFVATNEAFCTDQNNMYKFKVDLDVSGSHGRNFGDVSGQFMHIVYTVEPSSNQMAVYLDGVKMASSGIDTAFGLQKSHSFLALPTWYYGEDIDGTIEKRSFEYNLTSTNSTLDFTNGPKLNTNTTPWILGGGYTDGFLVWEGHPTELPTADGFMSRYHGKVSGLYGHLGSTKFYSKALSLEEVQKNYNAQAPYFKNIDL